MKKILIPALLVVSAVFAPGLRNAVEFPDRTCEVVQSVVAPLFWHLWDELLNREIARLTQPLTPGGECPGSGGVPRARCVSRPTATTAHGFLGSGRQRCDSSRLRPIGQGHCRTTAQRFTSPLRQGAIQVASASGLSTSNITGGIKR